MPSLHHVEKRRCACGVVYELVRWSDETWSDIDGNDAADECPACHGQEFQRILEVGTGVELGGTAGVGKVVPYPYWCDTLQAMVTSAQHRRQLADAKGLVCLDGAMPTGRSAAQREWDASADAGRDFLARQAEEPWYRRMKDHTSTTNRKGEVVFDADAVRDYQRYHHRRDV